MAIRTIIVDDEPLALHRLSDLLVQSSEIELLAELKGGREALDAIDQLKPDIVFLDIEMPRLDGFDVVETLASQGLDEGAVPLVCFVTAFPQFAAEAFDRGALDFLCKPVRLARLVKTIERAKMALGRREAASRLKELSLQLDDLRRAHASPASQAIWIQSRTENVRLEIGSIDWIRAEGEYVRLHSGSSSFLLRQSLAAIGTELPADQFVQIHRSIVINLDRLKGFRRSKSGMKLFLDTDVELPVGRKFRPGVNALVEK